MIYKAVVMKCDVSELYWTGWG